MLREAAETERINVASLHEIRKWEEEEKARRKTKGPVLTGPRVLYHSKGSADTLTFRDADGVLPAFFATLDGKTNAPDVRRASLSASAQALLNSSTIGVRRCGSPRIACGSDNSSLSLSQTTPKQQRLHQRGRGTPSAATPTPAMAPVAKPTPRLLTRVVADSPAASLTTPPPAPVPLPPNMTMTSTAALSQIAPQTAPQPPSFKTPNKSGAAAQSSRATASSGSGRVAVKEESRVKEEGTADSGTRETKREREIRELSGTRACSGSGEDVTDRRCGRHSESVE